MKGPERRAERNKERVLRAALELFQAHGIKKVAINDIAQKAGVTPATVYNRFGSKDALVRDVVKNWYMCTLKDYQKVLRAEQPFESRKWMQMNTLKTPSASRKNIQLKVTLM